MAQYDVDLRDYWRIIKKRKTSIICMILLVGFCSYGFAKIKEPVPLYEASSAIKIDRFSNMASILTGDYWRQSENMVTHTYIITSFPVLCQTARSLGWMPENISDETAQNSQKYLSIIRRLKSMVEPEHQEGTNIINILVSSDNAQESARVANAFAQSYRDYNIQEKKKTFETKAFIKEQLQLTSNRLKLAENELQAFKQTYGLISLDAQTQNTLNRLFAVETEFEKTKIEKAEAESQLRMIHANKIGSSGGLKESFFAARPNSPVFGLKTKLSDLMLKRQTLLINFTENHPRIKEIDDQIQAVLHETKKELQSLLNSYKTREKDLSQRIFQLRRENLSLPEKGLLSVRLQRNVELQESLYSQLKKKYQETLIQESGKVEEVTILKPAVRPDQPFNIPSKLMIVVTGILMGLVIGVVFAFLAEVFDTSMGTIEDVEELLNVSVLGVIPQLDNEIKDRLPADLMPHVKGGVGYLVTHYEPKSMGAEAFRALRTNLQFLRLEMQGKLFLITSSFVQEGKTLNVINLALSMAQAGNKVLLVDGDLRKPLINKIFGLSKEPGITDYVLGNYPWQEVTNTISDVMLGDFGIDNILKTPGMDNINVVTAGTKPPNPSEILSSSRFREFLTEANKVYDFVFVDSPPILPVADATEIAPLMDGVFMVYTVGKIGRGVLKRAKSNLDNVDAKVLGIILNNVKPEAGPEYFKYHSQHYYGPEGESLRKKRKFSKWLNKIRMRLTKGRVLRFCVLIIALSMLALGIFWQDLHVYTNDWLSSLNNLFLAN